MECDRDFTDNGFVLNSYFIPEEILIRLLSFSSPLDLVRCRRVCKTWKYIIDDSEVWKLMISRSNMDSLSKFPAKEREKLIANNPWYLNYSILSMPFEKNLLLNNCGREKLNYWNVTLPPLRKNQMFWFVEPEPIFTGPLPKNDDFGSNTSCFSTSFVLCRKHQEIDLLERGFSSRILDEFQPRITVSEWYTGRYECGCKYTLRVFLLDGNREKILAEKSVEKQRLRWEDQEWRKVTIDFEEYGRGLRYVVFEHEGQDHGRGQDTQSELPLIENYGSKMSGGEVKLSFPQIAILG